MNAPRFQLYRTMASLFAQMRRRKVVGLGVMASLVVISLVGNTLCFYFFEPASKELTLWDSLWYSVISISTIGYGDFSAESVGARMGTS